MPNITVADLIKAIVRLDTKRIYDYPSGRGRLQITDVRKPEGPVIVNRWDVKNRKSEASITTHQLEVAASVFSARPNYPIHFDRLFSAGGNSRSVFETVLLYTPHFFICYPQRINPYTGSTDKALKHIMWCPDETHKQGETAKKAYTQVITEQEIGIDFGNIGVSENMLGKEFESIDVKRTHTQMQVALVEIGRALGFESWVASNDRSIMIGDTKLGELDGVISSLGDVPVLFTREIKDRASLIDCIWFMDNRTRIRTVIEVEHTTGVTSGLTRMLKLREQIPDVQMLFVIVAPDDLRSKVVKEANVKPFSVLRVRYLSYSTVRELYGLIKRYALSGYVDDRFIWPFTEEIVQD